jgi:membrane-associated phospholipid phosphatase
VRLGAVHRPRIKTRRAAPLVATAAASAAGFATVTTLVNRKRTRGFDQSVRQRVGTDHSSDSTAIVKALGYTGKSWVHGPASALLAWYVEHRGSMEGSRAINLASALASTVSKTCDWAIDHRAPPPGRHKPKEQSYPSGHTLETTAVALVGAYVLWREGLADPRVAFPVAAAIPLLEGAGRLFLDRHWASDIVGGLLGGLSVAAVCASGYEARRA